MIDPPLSAQREIQELLQFLYLMPVAVARFGADGALEMLNPCAVKLLQDLDIDTGHALGTTILDDLYPGLAQIWRESAGRVGSIIPPLRCTPLRAGRPTRHLTLQLVRPDDRCTMLVIEDTTRVVEQELEISRQRLRLGVVLQNIHGYCVVMLDLAGLIVDWNTSIGRFFGVGVDQLVGQPLLSLLAPHDQPFPGVPDFEEIGRIIALHGWWRLRAPWRRNDGLQAWGDCVFAAVGGPDGNTNSYVVVIRDVTEEEKRDRRLTDAALVDPLTRIYNRRGLEQRAAALLIRPGGMPAVQSWVMVDIDEFKQVNDRFGHESGDIVLKAVATALRAVAREGDLLARTGGEEFLLLLPDAAAADAAGIAERLRIQVQALVIKAAGQLIRVTACFGVAQQLPGESQLAVLARADAALYRAKRSGRNRVELAAAVDVLPARQPGSNQGH